MNKEHKIQCLECGNYQHYINPTHLKKCCALSTKQYREKYPNAEIRSEEYKQNMSIAAKKSYENGKIPWNKGLKNCFSEETCKKISLAKKGIKREKFTDDHCRNLRISTIDYLESCDGKLFPRYSKEACEFFDWFNKEFNLNGQHAENDGEYYIKELGYFLDYYVSELNLVFEWYEKHHYDADGNLREKDIRRQKEIKEYLGCKFIRINESDFGNFNEILRYIENKLQEHWELNGHCKKSMEYQNYMMKYWSYSTMRG